MVEYLDNLVAGLSSPVLVVALTASVAGARCVFPENVGVASQATRRANGSGGRRPKPRSQGGMPK